MRQSHFRMAYCCLALLCAIGMNIISIAPAKAQDSIQAALGFPNSHFCYYHGGVGYQFTVGYLTRAEPTRDIPVNWRLEYNSGSFITSGSETTSLGTIYLYHAIGHGAISRVTVTNYGGYNHVGNLGATTVYYKGTASNCPSCVSGTSSCICTPINYTVFPSSSGVQHASYVNIPGASKITVKRRNGGTLANVPVYVTDLSGNFYAAQIKQTNSSGIAQYNIRKDHPTGRFLVPYGNFYHNGSNVYNDFTTAKTETVELPSADSTFKIKKYGSGLSNTTTAILHPTQNTVVSSAMPTTNASGNVTYSIPDGTNFRLYFEDGGIGYSSDVMTAPTSDTFRVTVSNYPALQSPLNGASYTVGADIPFNWATATGATLYRLMVNYENTGWQGVLTTSNQNSINFDTPGRWYWLVQSFDSEGYQIGESAQRYVDISGASAKSMGDGHQEDIEELAFATINGRMLTFCDEVLLDEDELLAEEVALELQDVNDAIKKAAKIVDLKPTNVFPAAEKLTARPMKLVDLAEAVADIPIADLDTEQYLQFDLFVLKESIWWADMPEMWLLYGLLYDMEEEKMSAPCQCTGDCSHTEDDNE